MSSEGDRPVSARTVVISESVWTSLGFAPNFLRRASVRLISARTGSEALSLARASDPSLLILDYASPLLSGDEVCRKFKSTGGGSHKVPVVIVGPARPTQIKSSCRKAGCDLYLPTPLDVPALLARMAEYLQLPDRMDARMSVILSISYGTVTSEVLGESRDLSEGGIGLTTSQPLRQGFYINLKFFLADDRRPIVAPGQIVRVSATEEGVYDIGIRFLTLPRESRERIQRFLRQPLS